MLINLYSVRVLLRVLGAEDYGLFNVVGGVVTLLSFISGTLNSASMRFFSYEIGKKSNEGLKKVFGSSLAIFIILSVILFILFETIGLWFVNRYLNIPENRILAVNYLYQFSVFSFIVTMLRTPYTALILACEKMKVFSFLSVLEAVMKLIAILIVALASFDKLIVYGMLIFVVSLLCTILYVIYSFYKFSVCKTLPVLSKEYSVNLLAFSGWNIIGAISSVAKYQGVNILLNIFFGALINAAMSIGSQVNAALQSFVSNIYLAVRPQITKSYAEQNYDYMLTLVFKSSKFSFFLTLLISAPLLLETDFLLKLWLVNIPNYTVVFVRLFIVNFLIESINSQLYSALQASGKIKKYQILVCTSFLLVLPLSYILLEKGFSHYSILWVSIAVNVVVFLPQIYIVRRDINFSIKKYFTDVISPIAAVSILVIGLPGLITIDMECSWSRFILSSFVIFVSWVIFVWYVGMQNSEKAYLYNYIYRRLNK